MKDARSFTIGDIEVKSGQKGFGHIEVADVLGGFTLSLPVHVVHGSRPGPTLGLTAAIHGTEYPPILALREVVLGLNPQELRGTLIVLPVANPVSLAARHRKNTPEWDVDHANMGGVFPGKRLHAAFGGGPVSYTHLTLPTTPYV